jgi:hypothetical protein
MARIWFDNGYGASVINDPTFSGFEVAVIAGTEDDWEIVYDTPVTDDVVRALPLDTMKEVLDEIKALPSRR